MLTLYTLMNMYFITGAVTGATVFVGNMVSTCIPENPYVDPNYKYENMTFEKIREVFIISTTKAIIMGVGAPFFIFTYLMTGDPKNFFNFYLLGYAYSPHYLVNNPQNQNTQ